MENSKLGNDSVMTPVMALKAKEALPVNTPSPLKQPSTKPSEAELQKIYAMVSPRKHLRAAAPKSNKGKKKKLSKNTLVFGKNKSATMVEMHPKPQAHPMSLRRRRSEAAGITEGVLSQRTAKWSDKKAATMKGTEMKEWLGKTKAAQFKEVQSMNVSLTWALKAADEICDSNEKALNDVCTENKKLHDTVAELKQRTTRPDFQNELKKMMSKLQEKEGRIIMLESQLATLEAKSEAQKESLSDSSRARDQCVKRISFLETSSKKMQVNYEAAQKAARHHIESLEKDMETAANGMNERECKLFKRIEELSTSNAQITQDSAVKFDTLMQDKNQLEQAMIEEKESLESAFDAERTQLEGRFDNMRRRYFHACVLAIKMSMNEDVIINISGEELYEEAEVAEIPVSGYANWISSRINLAASQASADSVCS